MTDGPITIFWFRRDLRLDDNAGLYRALKAGRPVLSVFIFDTDILDKLDDKYDRRVDFIHQAVTLLHGQLAKAGSTLLCLHGTAKQCITQLLQQYKVAAVYTNQDYEPAAIERDAQITSMLASKGISFHSFKDQVVFEKNEVIKDDGKPYTVYTPYSKKWKERLTAFYLKPYPTLNYTKCLLLCPATEVVPLDALGFKKTDLVYSLPMLNEQIAATYNETRDYPAINGTTRLSVHLRFGTISIRQLAAKAGKLNQTLLNELIWRDFYMMILWHFPHVVGSAFKPAYNNIQWRNNVAEFGRWKNGTTGYPIVDAGMRELLATGYMHNRVRMITASFLTKHLLIDWHWGEAWFAEKLLDYDLAANNGGWQWAAGSGCDAAPYFRVFNPQLQTEKFDAEHLYIKKWVPEYAGFSYVRPIVDHKAARERCLAAYKAALKE